VLFRTFVPSEKFYVPTFTPSNLPPGLRFALPVVVAASLAACASTALPPGPRYQPSTTRTEAEYQPFLQAGANVLEGQAIRRSPDGRSQPVAGRSVTLDPATTTGNDWWRVAGRSFPDRLSLPPSDAFLRARRVTVTDVEGRFAFRNLPAGTYYLRTDYGGTGPGPTGVSGGLLGQRIEIPVAGPIVLDALAD
jgi:hypothetical protein